MAQTSKLGTFGGVFTPSILTILGVIMYMRLPWVVGNAGLYGALSIVLVAHVISICTGLSISSIATDKNVGAGGPYYILSRSLGLPIGGAIGLALFTGLAFSVSLYIIGFSESFLATFKIAINPTSIRICGTVFLVLVTAITLISTEFAIKTQYLILGLIAVSLLAIAFASPPAPTGPQLSAPEGGKQFAELFGIFFPAVTGFTAGVNMSGDLKDAKKAIPRGTMAAIAGGMLIYVGLTVFFSMRFNADALMNDPAVLNKAAFWNPALVGGIWGATLSSAIGSIMGAPRILQAMSADGITPRIFAHGYGKTNEPRNALVLAFIVALGGILIAELDAIARIVSMVFLTMYGFLNLSAALESWASPDFRPAFRIPRWVSLIGAVFAIVVMILLDLPAMIGASLVMVGLFAYLNWRELRLESGDTWEGFWASLVRSGLYRLSRERGQQRNWRPHILAFHHERSALPSFAATLVSGSGVLNSLCLVQPGAETKPESNDAEQDRLGIFAETLESADDLQTIRAVTRYRSFPGLEPNTVLLEWGLARHAPEKLDNLLDELIGLDKNLLLFAHSETHAATRTQRIDVWWHEERGNFPLSLALARFISSADEWKDATLRFVVATSDGSATDSLRAAVRRMLKAARVEAPIRVVVTTLKDDAFEQKVQEESHDAALVLLGLPLADSLRGAEFVQRTDTLVQHLERVLLIHGSSAFPETLGSSRQASVSFLPPLAEERELPALELPEARDLKQEAERMADAYQHWLSGVFEGGLSRLYGPQAKLLTRLRDSFDRHFSMLTAGLDGKSDKRRQTLVNRVQSSFLREARELLDEYERALPAARSALEGAVEACLGDEDVVDKPGQNEELRVERPASDFVAREDDSARLKRLKRRKRWGALLRRGKVRYRIPVSQLRRYHFVRAVSEIVTPALQQAAGHMHKLVIALGKLLSASKTTLSLLDEERALGAAVGEFVARRRGAALEHVERLIVDNRERTNHAQWSLLVESRKLAQAYADDLAHPDAQHLIQNQRRPAQRADTLSASLSELAEQWSETQDLLLQRARLGLSLSNFHHRLAGVAWREKEVCVRLLRTGVLAECEQLLQKLRGFRAQLNGASSAPARLERSPGLDKRFDERRVLDKLARETAEVIDQLPETAHTLSDEGIEQLEEGRGADLALTDLSVRRLARYLVETELLSGIQEVLSRVNRSEHQAASAAEDVLRLVDFHLAETHELSGAAGVDELGRVVDAGIERLEREIKPLAELLDELSRTVDSRLALVLDATNPYDLSSTASNIEQNIRLHQGKKAVSGARWALRRYAERARDLLVELTYRRSAGVVMARRLAAGVRPERRVVDRMLELTSKASPTPALLDRLPFYYRQLFVGPPATNDAFWVARASELSKARRAAAAQRAGNAGALLVVGERGSGKTALCQRIVSDVYGECDVYRVMAAVGASPNRAAFHDALERAFDRSGSPEQLLGEVATPGSVLLMDDLDLWWQRSPGGFAVLEELVELIERYGARLTFLLAAGTHAFAFVNRFLPLSDHALAVIECGALPAADLAQLITRRHASSGLRYELSGRDEERVSPLQRARLFSRHFDQSTGLPGLALRSWLAHVDQVSGDVLQLRQPEHLDSSVVDDLAPGDKALLIQILLHKQLSRERLCGLSNLPVHELDRRLALLQRGGMVIESGEGVLNLNLDVSHHVVERFRRGGFLP